MTIEYKDSKRIVALSSDALVAHLKFNDDVTDSAGSNNGTVTGTTTYVTGKIGKAFSFNGSSYITLANESNFDFERTDSFSVSFWMKTSTSQDIKMLLGKSELNTTGWHVWLRQGTGSTGDIHFNLTNTDATNELEVRIQSLATFDDNWHHVVFTYDGTSDVTGVTGYFDNSVISNGTVSNTLTSSILNNLPVSIGDTPNGGARDYTGSMDDVRIYSRKLDQSEVTMIYNSGNGTEENKPTNVQDNSLLVEKDTAKRYWFDGTTWNRGYFPITRGVIAGGEQSPISNIMDYITIATLGDATDFGDLTQARYGIASMYSDTRGVFACGYNGGYFNIIDYITILTAGNATDFGDASTATYSQAGVNSKTRGVFASNGASRGSNLDYITIATTGNATSGFGNLTRSTTSIGGNVNSETRGVFLAGNTSGDVYSNVMDYITIDTTGNAIDFGDLTVGRYSPGGLSSETRGVIFGGNISSGTTNNIDYITIDTTGNATDFGDLSSIRSAVTGGLTNYTRGVMAGGASSSGKTNVIEYITIDTTGNATDFGDLTLARTGAGGVSG